MKHLIHSSSSNTYQYFMLSGTIGALILNFESFEGVKREKQVARAMIKLQRRQFGNEAIPCSHGTIVARCQEKAKITERTRRRTRSS